MGHSNFFSLVLMCGLFLVSPPAFAEEIREISNTELSQETSGIDDENALNEAKPLAIDLDASQSAETKISDVSSAEVNQADVQRGLLLAEQLGLIGQDEADSALSRVGEAPTVSPAQRSPAEAPAAATASSAETPSAAAASPSNAPAATAASPANTSPSATVSARDNAADVVRSSATGAASPSSATSRDILLSTPVAHSMRVRGGSVDSRSSSSLGGASATFNIFDL